MGKDVLAMFIFFHEFCTDVQVFGCEFIHTPPAQCPVPLACAGGMCNVSYVVLTLVSFGMQFP